MTIQVYLREPTFRYLSKDEENVRARPVRILIDSALVECYIDCEALDDLQLCAPSGRNCGHRHFHHLAQHPPNALPVSPDYFDLAADDRACRAVSRCCRRSGSGRKRFV